MTRDGTLLQKLRHDLVLGGRIEKHLASAQPVLLVREQIVQRHHHVVAGHVGGDMIGIGDADIGRRPCGNIRDHVVVDIAVIRVQTKVHGNVRIQLLKIRDGLLVNLRLVDVRIVLRPEGDLVLLRGVKFLRHGKRRLLPLPVAAGQKTQAQKEQKRRQLFSNSYHPFIPPLDTPSMIFLRNARNRMISGTEITTTAAIIAGMFSRPKPFSRISWIPLDTR